MGINTSYRSKKDNSTELKLTLSKYTLEDLHLLHGLLKDWWESDKKDTKKYRKLEQLFWALDKNNTYIKGLRNKKNRVKELLLSPSWETFSFRTNKNMQFPEQASLVFKTPITELPLRINDLSHPIAKVFLSWRLKIGK